jgi:hypothetical protein
MARVSVGDAEGVADAEAVGVAVVATELLANADDVPAAPGVDPPGVHAARAAAAVPVPKNSPRERRLISVERSNSRPRSWFGWGSWGGCGEVVMDPIKLRRPMPRMGHSCEPAVRHLPAAEEAKIL